MCRSVGGKKKTGFFVADDCHPQTIGVVKTRAEAAGTELHVGALDEIDFEAQKLCGVLIQYPNSDGALRDPSELIERAHAAGALVVVATDLGLVAFAVVRLAHGGAHELRGPQHERVVEQTSRGQLLDEHGNRTVDLSAVLGQAGEHGAVRVPALIVE